MSVNICGGVVTAKGKALAIARLKRAEVRRELSKRILVRASSSGNASARTPTSKKALREARDHPQGSGL